MIPINELQQQTKQLPDTIEDLSQFVLVGRATLRAYMMRLQTIDRLSMAQEVRDQTFKEAQEVANALVAAEQRIGEILLSIQKRSGGDRKSEEFKNRDASNYETKAETTSRMGYSKDQVSQYQQMALNPEVVDAVIKKAMENGEIVSRSQVIKEIRALKEELRVEKEKREKAESKEPEVREVTKEIVREIIPEDYELLKARVNNQSKEEKRLTDEYHKIQKENAEQKARIKQLEERDGIHEEQARLEREAEYFDMHVTNFIRTVGGYVWITERLDSLPEDKRNRVVQNIKNINAWTQQMILNIGGDLIGK